ncbi:MAG: hypothetical protein QGG40_03045, partial [Myxococcota bacterium]|nr:hypothetical protein [Myxococcota bacterium]
ATWMAYHEAEVLSGNALDALPEAAWPHVRAALTWEMLARSSEKEGELGLTEWSERATDALSLRAPAPVTGTSDTTMAVRRRQPGAIDPGWTENRGTEESLDWVHHLQRSRRVKGSDAELDLLIALLEAAATQDTPRTTLLVEGLGHAHELVRWTALRLMIELGVPDAKQRAEALSEDPSTLVRDLLSFEWKRMRRKQSPEVGRTGHQASGTSAGSGSGAPATGKKPNPDAGAQGGKKPNPGAGAQGGKKPRPGSGHQDGKKSGRGEGAQGGKKPNPGKKGPPGQGPGADRLGGDPG